MRAVNCYVLRRRFEMKPILQEASLSQILGSPRVQRYRLSLLYLLLLGLARVPHLDRVERLFRRRWSSRFEPRKD